MRARPGRRDDDEFNMLTTATANAADWLEYTVRVRQ
jgi:hypothetical protein